MAKGRRGYGTGSIREEDGKFKARWYDEHGSQRERTCRTRKDADRVLRREIELVYLRKRGLDDQAGLLESPMFPALCQQWLEMRTDKRSLETDESFIRNHLEPYFEHYSLEQITSAVADVFRRHQVAAGLSNGTVNHHLTLLGSMLGMAVELKWLERVPKIRKLKRQPKPYKYLETSEEIEAFLKAAAEHEQEMAFPLFATAIYTGLRKGELFGLRRRCIDFRKKLITVQWSYDEQQTKSAKIRHAPLMDRLRPILRQWLASQKNARVFPAANGLTLRRDSFISREVLETVCEVAQVRRLSLHDLRHTFASHWVMNDGSLRKLQEILGHADSATTQRYAHLAPHAFRDDLDRF